MTPKKFSNHLLVLVAVCLACVSISHAQPNAKPKHLKSDQLLLDAAAHNGLGDNAATPWHVKARYELFDDHGKHKSSGTFEEWWFSPTSYKTVFSGDDLNQTDVATGAGLFRSGDQRWTTRQENMVHQLIADPLQVHPYDPRRNDLVDESRAVGTAKLRCIFLLTKPPLDAPVGSNLNTNLDLVPTYCFEADSSHLLYASGGAGRDVMLLNNFAALQGRTVAREIHLMNNRQEWVVIHITEMSAPGTDAASLQPPSGASGPLTGRIELPADRLRSIGPPLDLSPSTMSEMADADFAVKAVIGKDGRVLEATLVKGPPNLAAAISKAARKLVFAPFTIAGQPVEVETTVAKSDMVTMLTAGQSGRGRR